MEKQEKHGEFENLKRLGQNKENMTLQLSVASSLKFQMLSSFYYRNLQKKTEITQGKHREECRD